MSISDRFRRALGTEEDWPDGENPGPAGASVSRVDLDRGPVDAIVGVEAEMLGSSLAARPITASSNDAPWRAPSSPTPPAQLAGELAGGPDDWTDRDEGELGSSEADATNPAPPEIRIEVEATRDRETRRDDGAVPLRGRAEVASVDPTAPDARRQRRSADRADLADGSVPAETGFKPWESPMSSGFESTLETLTAAFNASEEPSGDDVLLRSIDGGGRAEDEPPAISGDATVDVGLAEPAADARPAALPLASPAFARSKVGAMRRDEGLRTDDSAIEAKHRGVEPADRIEVVDSTPRPSIFAPSMLPADGPRATAYGLGEKTADDAPVDPLAGLKRRVEEALLRRIGTKLAEGELSEEELRGFVERELGVALGAERTALSAGEREQIVARLTDDLLGHGPIEQFLKDESVTEVMVSGLEPMYVERAGRLELTDVRFDSESQLRQVIERIVGRVGRRVDESSPMVDARLPDGSRVNAIIPPLAVDGPALTIRKFSQRALTVADLVAGGSLSQNAADMLSACVRGRLNILVTGGTGSGKTTMLNILSSFIPDDQRIVTIEDAVELRLNQHHVVRLEARPPNIEGRGAVSIRELVRNALRMRPDRIIVGEVRSGEALDMLQAMNTGHDGSLSTLHANTPRDVLARLETMVLMAGFELPVRAIREQITSAVDLIVHISRLRDGTRRVTHIVEVEGMEGEVITLTDLYLFDFSAGVDGDGKFKGNLKATGLRPKFAERLADLGIEVPLPSRGFDPTGEIAAPAGFGWNR
jgi:pilus assembly protein CpaF